MKAIVKEEGKSDDQRQQRGMAIGAILLAHMPNLLQVLLLPQVLVLPHLPLLLQRQAISQQF